MKSQISLQSEGIAHSGVSSSQSHMIASFGKPQNEIQSQDYSSTNQQNIYSWQNIESSQPFDNVQHQQQYVDNSQASYPSNEYQLYSLQPEKNNYDSDGQAFLSSSSRFASPATLTVSPDPKIFSQQIGQVRAFPIGGSNLRQEKDETISKGSLFPNGEEIYNYQPYRLSQFQASKQDGKEMSTLTPISIRENEGQTTPGFDSGRYTPIASLDQFQGSKFPQSFGKNNSPANEKKLANNQVGGTLTIPNPQGFTYHSLTGQQGISNNSKAVGKIDSNEHFHQNQSIGKKTTSVITSSITQKSEINDIKERINNIQSNLKGLEINNSFGENDGRLRDMSSGQLQAQIAELKKQLEIRSHLIENTYKLSFLMNKDKPFDILKILENYVLLCAENEKLSFGFIDKLAKIDQLSTHIHDLTIQKENWKTLYDNKSTDFQLAIKEQGNQQALYQELQKNLQELQKQNNTLQEAQSKEEQLLIQENENLRAEVEELTQKCQENDKQRDLEEKLMIILGENEQLNKLLSERVDEVTYLQETIKQLQDTYASQFNQDSRLQKVIQDLEIEIKRMDGKMEGLIKESEGDKRAKALLEEENNNLRSQFQQKRKELEEGKLSAGMASVNEVTIRKKQEQIEELLIKIERLQRNVNELQEQREELKIEDKSIKDAFVKLERKYDEKQKENMELLVKNADILTQLKQIKVSRDTSFLEKDLHQASFERKQLEIQINEIKYDHERTKNQLEMQQQEVEDLTKQLLIQKQKSADRESVLQDEIQKLRLDTTKEQENFRLKAKVEVQEDLIQQLKYKFTQSEQKINELALELQESRFHLKEVKQKLDKISVMEGTLHTMDKENDGLLKINQQAGLEIENLHERILRMCIENERLHKVVEEINEKNEEDKQKVEGSAANYQDQLERIEADIIQERGEFQEVIKELESRLAEAQIAQNNKKTEEQQQYHILQQEFLALKGEFELAIETLKTRDQHIFYLEGKYNQALSGDRNNYIIKKMEEKLNILSAENMRLNKILVDRVRFSQNGW